MNILLQNAYQASQSAADSLKLSKEYSSDALSAATDA